MDESKKQEEMLRRLRASQEVLAKADSKARSTPNTTHQSKRGEGKVKTAASDNYALQIVGRYKDAYRTASYLVWLGNIIKTVGLVFAGLIALYFLALQASIWGGGLVVIGLIIAAFIGGISFVFGITVSAQGQSMRASLDTAIAASPFLTDAQRAEAMGLSS